MKVTFKEENRGTIITPYYHQVYGGSETLEVNFNQIYKGCYSFARYGVIQFNIEADDINTAVEMAKDRINDIMANGFPNERDVVVVSGYRYDESNNKIPYNLSFMENTHHLNQFTAKTYKADVGTFLKYDCDGDGWGFWYAVDESGKRISGRLKGGIFTGYSSDGVIIKCP